MTAHPDLTKDLRRDFEVHENCYDCADFYDGCQGWRASKDFECRDFNRLPDVLPGTCGQVFPPARRRAQARPEPEPIEQDPPESSRQTAPEPDPASPVAIDTTPSDPRAQQSGQLSEPGNPKARRCGCGAELLKGKRLCKTCRTESRRRTKRQYMRTYMKEHRPAAVGSDPDVPFTPAATHPTWAGGDDPALTGQREGVPPVLPTSVLTPATLQTGPGEPPNPDGRHAADDSLGTHLPSLNSTHRL